MATPDDQILAVRKILEKQERLTGADLDVLRHNTIGAIGHSSKSDAFMFRMEIELMDAIRALDETSTELINKTNKLTTVIMVLTGVGIFIAAVGIFIALLQLFKK